MKRPARVPLQLSESLHQLLNAYALVAGAAGVGILALAQPTEARIVYTPAHLNCSDFCRVDVNNDGHTELQVSAGGETSATSCAFISNVLVVAFTSGSSPGNTVIGKGTNWRFVSALPAGALIGAANNVIGNMAVRKPNHCNHTTAFTGPWANGGKGVKNRYLGLKFYFKKQAHYGWLRFNVAVHRQHNPVFQVTLTGYAYETIPNKPIVAGQEHGNDEATLGHLATGASAIPAWRVKQTAATTH
jgi:hypothetical protein